MTSPVSYSHQANSTRVPKKTVLIVNADVKEFSHESRDTQQKCTPLEIVQKFSVLSLESMFIINLISMESVFSIINLISKSLSNQYLHVNPMISSFSQRWQDIHRLGREHGKCATGR